jgi:hypothetical protein
MGEYCSVEEFHGDSFALQVNPADMEREQPRKSI